MVENKIAERRGYPPSEIERRLLRLPLFFQIEKNSHYFSEPNIREEIYFPGTTRRKGWYPKELGDMVRQRIYEIRDLRQSDLSEIGLSLSDFGSSKPKNVPEKSSLDNFL